MKKIFLLLLFICLINICSAIDIKSQSKIIYGTNYLSQDKNVYTTIKPIDDITFEINIKEKPLASKSYLWNMAICDLTKIENVSLVLADKESGQYDELHKSYIEYDLLSSKSLPNIWCKETDFRGYAIFSLSDKQQLPLLFKITLPSSKKTFKILTGVDNAEEVIVEYLDNPEIYKVNVNNISMVYLKTISEPITKSTLSKYDYIINGK